MNHDPDSLFGIIRDNLLLTQDERDDMSHSLRSIRLLAPAVSSLNPTQLFAYEKSLMFGALQDLKKGLPLRRETNETPDIHIRVWHGTLFSHLQPFVLR